MPSNTEERLVAFMRSVMERGLTCAGLPESVKANTAQSCAELFATEFRTSSRFADIERMLEGVRCPACAGRGKRDDGEPGDSYYKEWDCEACAGSGVRSNAKITLQVEA